MTHRKSLYDNITAAHSTRSLGVTAWPRLEPERTQYPRATIETPIITWVMVSRRNNLSSYLFFNSRSSSVIIETGKRRGRALRAHRPGLLLLLEPLEELDARLGLDILAGLAADLLGVGQRADLARAVDLRAIDGGDEALEPGSERPCNSFSMYRIYE